MKHILSFLIVLMISSYAYTQKSRQFLSHETTSTEQQINSLIGKKINKADKISEESPKQVEEEFSEDFLLYGVIAQRNSWNDGTVPAAFGMYSFNITSDIEKLEFTPLFCDDRMISTNHGVYVDGKYYLFYTQRYYGMFQSLTLIVFDGDEGNVIEEIPVTGATSSDVPYCLTYDPTSQNVYGYVQSDKDYLVKVNLETGKVERIGELSDTFFVLSTSYSGIIYGITNRGTLKTIDKTTAATTTVGETGFEPMFHQSAAIDQRTGNMYWAYHTWKAGKLLKVNVNDASTTEIVSFSDGETIIGLHIRRDLAESQAPAQPENLKVSFENPGDFNTIISGSAPTKTFDGNELTNNMSILLYINGNKTDSIENVAPGENFEFEYTFETEGKKVINISAKCDNNESPKSIVETYIGIDTPKTVNNLTLVLDDVTGEYTLTWDAPDHIGMNNGLIDTEKLTYRIISYPSCKVLEENYTGTSLSGTITDKELQSVFFGVIAQSNGKESSEAYSNRIKFGKTIRIPYNEDFETDMTWDLHTVKDANNDGYTWTLENGRASYKGINCPDQANDWLFTPAIEMYANITYTLYVTFDGGYWQTESFRIVASPGTDLTNPGMKTIYNKTQEFSYGQISTEFTPEKDGTYYFGFNCYSQANIRGISIDSYNIVASANPNAPDDVEDLTVIPAELGELSANISFYAPTQTVNGDPLEENSITSIEVYRENSFEPFKTFLNPVNGQKYEFTDTAAIHGTNTYKVISYSEIGNSNGITASEWVGEDYASKPLNFTAEVDYDKKRVHFNWEEPEGSLHNGYVNKEKMTYTLLFMIPEITEDFSIIAENIEETNYTDSIVTKVFLEMKDQYDIIFIACATTSAGMGEPATASQSTGSSYGIPYWESFSNGYLTTAPWTVQIITDTENDCWLLVEDSNSPFNVTSFDSDGGSAMFYQPQCNAEARLIGPRINLQNTVKPVLRFYMYHDITVSEDNYLQMEIRKENEDQFTNIAERILVNNSKYGWIGHEISLEDYIDIKDFRISFHGVAEKDVDFYVDNISINEAGMWDGYPSVSDLKATRENSNTIKLTWSVPNNEASFNILGYDIYMDDVKHNTEVITTNQYEVQVSDNNSHSFKAKVIYEFGESMDSNTAIAETVGLADYHDNAMIYGDNGCIYIRNCEGEFIRIMTIDGKTVYSNNIENDEVIPVEQGVYIVKAKEYSYKIIVD